MTHKLNNAESIDLKINNLPVNTPVHGHGDKNQLTAKTPNSHDHWNEIGKAISEKDIISLREQLENTRLSAITAEHKRSAVFDLTDMLDVAEVLEENQGDRINFFDTDEPLPKIHIHHHHRANTENIHHFYLEQSEKMPANAENDIDAEIDPGWQLLEEALRETDIMELRESLQQIARSVPTHNYSAEDIERYFDGEMDVSEYSEFEAELSLNPELNRDVNLHSEVMEAISETDIISLREQLTNVIHSQNSTSRSLTEIEGFLNNEITEKERDIFIGELTENQDLKAEVNLVKDLNRALSENDIIRLRDELQKISHEVYRQNVNSVLPVPGKHFKFKRVGTYAAIFIFLAGLSALTWFINGSRQSIYDHYFSPPQAISSFRSAEENTNTDLKKGFESYNQADYIAALNNFSKVLQTDGSNPVAHFYAGASYQNMRQYREALIHYQCVINHNNNLFVEQAEWLKALCYLGISDKKSAVMLLQAVIDRKGFYEKDAFSLLSKLKRK